MKLIDIRHRVKGVWRRGGKRNLIAGALNAAYFASRAGLLSHARGNGAVFTLHHVRPLQQPWFEPNAHLEVTPEFLDAAICRLRSDGYDFVRLDEVPARLQSSNRTPFAAFTLDDGYHNNAQHALPVFERHGVPFTIFITRGFAERTHSLWWETLEEILPQRDSLEFDFGQGPETIDLSTSVRVQDCFKKFVRYVWQNDEAEAVTHIDALARRNGIDPLALTAKLVMGPEDLKRLVEHPLACLGAHTVSHRAISRLSPDDARAELRASADWLEQLTGQRPKTFAFPYGNREAVSARDIDIAKELGFSVAVLTQPGTLSGQSMGHLTGLPRISLNGYFQRAKYVSALASGIPFLATRRKTTGTS